MRGAHPIFIMLRDIFAQQKNRNHHSHSSEQLCGYETEQFEIRILLFSILIS